MRIQLFIAEPSREVWAEARKAAQADSMSLSELAACAVREYLDRRRKRLARSETAVTR